MDPREDVPLPEFPGLSQLSQRLWERPNDANVGLRPGVPEFAKKELQISKKRNYRACWVWQFSFRVVARKDGHTCVALGFSRIFKEQNRPKGKFIVSCVVKRLIAETVTHPHVIPYEQPQSAPASRDRPLA